MGITYLPSQHTDSNPGHKYEFSLKVILVQSEQQAKFYFKKKKKNKLQTFRRDTSSVMGWLYLLSVGYGHLSLKAPLCLEQLNLTKENQLNKARKLGWVSYENCQCTMSFKTVIDMEQTGLED